MNDKAYEQELDTLQQEMLLVLDELHDDLGSWNNRDILAAQRALPMFSRKASPSRAGIQATSPIGLGVKWIP